MNIVKSLITDLLFCFILVICFFQIGFLCCPGCPGTQSVEQASHLLLTPECGIKGAHCHTQLVLYIPLKATPRLLVYLLVHSGFLSTFYVYVYDWVGNGYVAQAGPPRTEVTFMPLPSSTLHDLVVKVN